MNRNTLVVDLALAAGIAILVLILAPGLAVVGLLALVVLLISSVSFAIDLRRRRGPTRRPRRARPRSGRDA